MGTSKCGHKKWTCEKWASRNKHDGLKALVLVMSKRQWHEHTCMSLHYAWLVYLVGLFILLVERCRGLKFSFPFLTRVQLIYYHNNRKLGRWLNKDYATFGYFSGRWRTLGRCMSGVFSLEGLPLINELFIYFLAFSPKSHYVGQVWFRNNLKRDGWLVMFPNPNRPNPINR